MCTLTDLPANPWFFASNIPAAGEVLQLDAREARHATGARRLLVDDPVTIFDGCGSVARGQIVDLGRAKRDGIRIRVSEVTQHEARGGTGCGCHLITAVPKGDRLATLLSMTAQLGVRSITGLASQHAVRTQGTTGDRARRICIEACKQSRHPWLPELRPVVDIPGLCSQVSADARGCWIVAHPGGMPLMQALAERGCAAGSSETHCVVGPEGGLTDDEVRELQHAGCLVASLGETILRIETAAVAMCAAVRLSG